jgi:hypothetical protein
VSTLREDFEAWALQERYAERNAHGLWFANNVHEFSLWKGYQAATERAAKLAATLAYDAAIKYANGREVDFEKEVAAAIRAQGVQP